MNRIIYLRCGNSVKQIIKSGFSHFKPSQHLHNIWAPKTVHLFHTSTPKRSWISKAFRKPTELQFKQKDNVPDGFTLIYRNGMGKYITLAQWVGTVTTGLFVVIFCIKKDSSTMEVPYGEWSSRTKNIENEGIIFISIFVFLVVMLHMAIMKTPMRIYKHRSSPQYSIILNGSLPFTTDKVVMDRSNIYQVEPRGALPWRDNRYLLEFQTEGKEVILFDQYFRRPADLAIMLGQQRDPDLN